MDINNIRPHTALWGKFLVALATIQQPRQMHDGVEGMTDRDLSASAAMP